MSVENRFLLEQIFFEIIRMIHSVYQLADTTITEVYLLLQIMKNASGTQSTALIKVGTLEVEGFKTFRCQTTIIQYRTVDDERRHYRRDSKRRRCHFVDNYKDAFVGYDFAVVPASASCCCCCRCCCCHCNHGDRTLVKRTWCTCWCFNQSKFVGRSFVSHGVILILLFCDITWNTLLFL